MNTEALTPLADQALADSPTYRSAWRAFRAWCQEQNRSALPATSETLLAYLVQRRGAERCAPATLDVVACAVAKVHEAVELPNPASSAVREFIREARRLAPGPRRLKLDELRAVMRACGDDVTGVRDRAMLLCVHHGRLSRIAVVSLDIEHLEQPGLAALRERASEAHLCPARALERWLDMRGNPAAGPLFVSVHASRFGSRLAPGDVYRVLRLRGQAAGVPALTTRVFRRPPAAP
jgi:integrase